MTPPKDHRKHNLPAGVGAILLRLLPSTKSNRDKQADMVIAWRISGGLALGSWLTKLFILMKKLGKYSPTSFLFQNGSNIPWTSFYYKTHHLYPYLMQQATANDPTLRHISLTSDFGIDWYFYSLHSYRRGAQSHCLRLRPGCKRGAYPRERIEHRRWRIKNQGVEDMLTHYKEASVEDRIYLTLLYY